MTTPMGPPGPGVGLGYADGGGWMPIPPSPGPRRRRHPAIWIALGLIVLLIAGAVGTGIYRLWHPGGRITALSQTTIGDCITVRGDSDALRVRKADCDAQTFSFYVAEKYARGGRCSDDGYNVLTQHGTDTLLCLTPNMKADKCYQFPSRTGGGGLVDIGDIACASPPHRATNVVVRVTQRGHDLDPSSCTDALEYLKPRRVVYCVEPVQRR
ncbi:hypothetical protein GCM10027169_26810 [Gordonia jinhuaensis]|uniref:Uncharacterized protein n=1 Tax=Gordonia jinhuaensis TaxID=1517702 RepID=A0A916TA44_9ACTN|nr:hypothetical protein [Gordonia jinhuaensis]GGB37577.1 hypothetical protein GCM10011489_26680 [Gordonia jinhuaensis]